MGVLSATVNQSTIIIVSRALILSIKETRSRNQIGKKKTKEHIAPRFFVGGTGLWRCINLVVLETTTEEEQLREWERMEEGQEFLEACRVANNDLWLCDDGAP